MPVESGLPTQVRRGKAITVRTHSRHAFVDANKHMLLDENEPAAEELLELEEEEEEELEQQAVADDSEELEMWMRQTRRAHLLTPAQEEHLAKKVQARDLAEGEKWSKVAELVNLHRDHDFSDFEKLMVFKDGLAAKQQLIESNLRLVVSIA